MNKTQCVRSRFTFCLASFIAFAIGHGPAQAIPGDTAEVAQRRTQSAGLISDLVFTRVDTLTESPSSVEMYNARGTYDGGSAFYSVVSDSGVSVSELANFYYPNTALMLDRESSEAFDFISALWGASVAEDFKASRFTDELSRPEYGESSQFYVGESYGYVVSTIPSSSAGSAIYTLSILNYEQWQERLEFQQFCSANSQADRCNYTG